MQVLVLPFQAHSEGERAPQEHGRALLCGDGAWTELKWPAQFSAFSHSPKQLKIITVSLQLREEITCSENTWFDW